MRRALAGLVLVATALPQAAFGWQEPRRGTAQRAALMDAIRPQVEWYLGPPVEFVVYDLRVQGDVAFANLYPQRPGGGAIDLFRTPGFGRGEFTPEIMDGVGLQALYRRSGQSWVVVHWLIGASDVWYATPEFCAVWRPVIPEACQGL